MQVKVVGLIPCHSPHDPRSEFGQIASDLMKRSGPVPGLILRDLSYNSFISYGDVSNLYSVVLTASSLWMTEDPARITWLTDLKTTLDSLVQSGRVFLFITDTEFIAPKDHKDLRDALVSNKIRDGDIWSLSRDCIIDSESARKHFKQGQYTKHPDTKLLISYSVIPPPLWLCDLRHTHDFSTEAKQSVVRVLSEMKFNVGHLEPASNKATHDS